MIIRSGGPKIPSRLVEPEKVGFDLTAAETLRAEGYIPNPIVIEQKFLPGDTDFRRQLRIIEDSRVDAIVLWTDIGPAANILKQMQELGMKQRVFGSHRTIGDELVRLTGPAAEGFEALYPYDPSRQDPAWLAFNQRFDANYREKPDHFASLSYDAAISRGASGGEAGH